MASFLTKRPGLAAAVAAALLLAFVAPAAAQNAAGRGKSPNIPNFKIAGKATAIEGDFLMVDGKTVRLMGVDAPDPGQRCKNKYGSEYDCFAIATAVLRNLVENDDVECVIADKDRNSQNQGECKVRGVDLGAAMVARGWAFAYRSLTPAYASAEAYAQTNRFGMWAGKVEKPWAWRSRQLREKAK